LLGEEEEGFLSASFEDHLDVLGKQDEQAFTSAGASMLAHYVQNDD
jgi:hypothetical protein